jgi:hypothetical protein
MPNKSSRSDKSGKQKPLEATGKQSKTKKVSAENEKSHWTVPAILGIAIGLVGLVGLIELRPQMEVLPKGELERAQPFSAPFFIHNSGYLAFHLSRAVCFAAKITTRQGSWTNGIVGSLDPSNVEIEAEHNEPVFCKFVHSDSPPEADITIVVDYTPLGFPDSYVSRKYFRFVGAYVDNWQWVEKTADATNKQSADEAIRKSDRSLNRITKQ